MDQPQSLIVFLAEIEDTRKSKGKRHEQLSILVIMIMAMLCGKTSLKSIARFAKAHRAEFAEYMPLPRGKIPSYSTFQRASLRIKIDDTCAAFASTGSAQAINGCHNI
jgi:predicted HTH domain antitoxin